ncbi:MAG: hypothetical protein ACLFSV_06885 [Alkalispirochaeta sp.]
MNGVGSNEYYPAHIEVLPSPAAPVYIKIRNDGTVHSITKDETAILRALFGCRSVEEHLEKLRNASGNAAAAIRAMEKDGAPGLGGLLERWITEGVLRPRELIVSGTAEDHRRRISRETAAGAPGAGGSRELLYATVTADRPESLQRWLRDFVDDRTFRRDAPTIVIDDSRQTAATAVNARNIADRRDRGVIHLTREGRRRWARAIVETAGPGVLDPELVGWALLGETKGYGEALVSTGAGRNVLLLAGIDRTVVTIDDDILPRFATFEEASTQAPRFGDAAEPFARLYPSMEELERDARIAEDPTQELVNALGRVHADGVDLSTISSDIACDLEASAGVPRCAVVRVGVYGARTVAEPYRVIARRSEFVLKDLNDGKALRTIQRHGVRARHATALTWGRHGFGASLFVFDGSRRMLPFHPWARQTDDVWPLLETWLHRDILFGDYPVAVFHDPSGRLPFDDRAIGRYRIGAGMYNVLVLRSLMRDIPGNDPERRLRGLIDRYREIGALRPHEFRGYLRHLQEGHLKDLREEIEGQLVAHRTERDGLEPIARERLLRRYQDSVIRELTNPDTVVPDELRRAPGTIGEKLTFLQENYRRWGELLEAWPEIRCAAALIGFEGLVKIANDD